MDLGTSRSSIFQVCLLFGINFESFEKEGRLFLIIVVFRDVIVNFQVLGVGRLLSPKIRRAIDLLLFLFLFLVVLKAKFDLRISTFPECQTYFLEVFHTLISHLKN